MRVQKRLCKSTIENKTGKVGAKFVYLLKKQYFCANYETACP